MKIHANSARGQAGCVLCSSENNVGKPICILVCLTSQMALVSVSVYCFTPVLSFSLSPFSQVALSLSLPLSLSFKPVSISLCLFSYLRFPFSVFSVALWLLFLHRSVFFLTCAFLFLCLWPFFPRLPRPFLSSFSIIYFFELSCDDAGAISFETTPKRLRSSMPGPGILLAQTATLSFRSRRTSPKTQWAVLSSTTSKSKERHWQIEAKETYSPREGDEIKHKGQATVAVAWQIGT